MPNPRKTDLLQALLNIDRVKADEILSLTLPSGFKEVEHLVIETLEEIGNGWENGTYSLAQVYMSGVICEELMDKHLNQTDLPAKLSPHIGIGVLLDHHMLGKRIVSAVARASGYAVTDLGAGLSVKELADAVIEQDIRILMVSVLMLPSALKIAELREQLRSRGKEVQIIVGGAPFRLDHSLWARVGADAQGKTAADIASVLDKMTEGVA